MPTQTLLESIKSPKDIKQLPTELLPTLANDIRNYILDIVSAKEGHLAASLGVVELTISLHYIFDTPDDALIFDVGHQAYPHKLLTGRFETFGSNRQWGGIAGFPSREENPYDSFGTGHASTSISAALGMATAAAIGKNLQRKHIAVIGDASLAGGMAFEALNNLSTTPVNLLIIINDNQMSIDNPVGALKDYLKQLGNGLSDTFFTTFGIHYLGSVNGHNFQELLPILAQSKQEFGIQLLHVSTTKGKGLPQAEKDPITYHAPGIFNRKTGYIPPSNPHLPDKFQVVFGKTLAELATNNHLIVGITPAMLSGSSLNYLKDAYPERTFDVGICEQHALTFAAGIACAGMRPFCVIYSSFLQRGYDQIIHDLALQKLPVVICIDRAGLVGEDGATHQGVFDIAYLRPIPNLHIFAPRNASELRNMLYNSQYITDGIICIRYPRGRCNQSEWEFPFEKDDIYAPKLLKKGTKYALLSVGTISEEVEHALQASEDADLFSHYDIRCIKPLPFDFLKTIFNTYERIITIEEGVIAGGFGSSVLEFASTQEVQIPISVMGIPDIFIPHGSVQEQRRFANIDKEAILKTMKRCKI